MKKGRVTQKQMALYKLVKENRENRDRYVPTWEFVGEMEIKELGKWVLMSYKCPTRLTDIYQENPRLLERTQIRGKSGSKYYGYRLRHGSSSDDIIEESLKEFYPKIRGNKAVG